MHFTWDVTKSERTARERGFNFAYAVRVFEGEVHVVHTNRDGERRGHETMKSKHTKTATRGKRTAKTERPHVDPARVDATTQEEIERHAQEDGDAWTPEMLARARTFRPNRQAITMRLDPRVLAFFQRDGRGYQSRINAALLAYVEAHERKAG